MSAGNTGSSKAFLNSIAGPRRMSGATEETKPKSPANGQFSGLMAQKRNSNCEGYKARRASWDEQGAQPGLVGGWWNKMMKG